MSYAEMTIRVSGVEDCIRTLQNKARRLQSTVATRVLMKAGQPARDTMAATAPVETGTLSKSMSVKVKRYRNGTVAATIGPKRGLVSTPQGDRDPGRYGHLVELGTQPHSTMKKGRRRIFYLGRISKDHPGSKAQRTMSKAWNRSGAAVEQTLVRELRSEVAKL